MYLGLLGASVVKNPPVKARDVGLILEVRKIPWRRDLFPGIPVESHSSILAWEIP